MDSKYLDTGVMIILFLILLTAPTQYAFNISNAYLSITDPLIWVGGLLFFLSALVRILFVKDSPDSLGKRFIATLKEILPLPENILFVILIALSFFKASSRFDTGKELFQIVEYIIVAFVLFSKVKISETLLRSLGILFLCLISIVVGIATYQYFDSSCPIMTVKGTFGNRNTYGGFLAISLPLILAIIIQIKNWAVKTWGTVILTFASITLLSGGAALALVIAGSIVCVFASIRAYAICLLILLIAFMFILPNLPRDNVEILKQSINIYDENAQVEPRYTEWQASIQMWEEDPLLGVGLGNYQSEIGSNFGFLTIKEGQKEHDHNNLFLVFASSTGFLGILGFLSMLLLWLKRAIVSFITYKPEINESSVNYAKILALGAMGVIIAFCITSIWTALLVRGVFPLFIIIVALAIGHSQTNTKKLAK